MTDAALPRVTYSNTGTDFSAVHDRLDRLFPQVEAALADAPLIRPLIDGAAMSGGEGFRVSSPIDHALPVATAEAASADMVVRAVATARAAQRAWAARPWDERAAIIRRAGDLLDAMKWQIGPVLVIEVGKSRMEAMGEAEEAADLARYYAAEMERNQGYGRVLPQARPRESCASVLRPYGVFGVIAPFNFPVALSVNMISAALVTGNAVVYKPGQINVASGRLLVQAFHEAGVPPAVLAFLPGGAATGAALAAADLDGIVFTGSHDVGMAIHRQFAAGPWARPVIVEMGGKNPAYVTASADLDRAAEGVARSGFGLQGQKCSALSKVYVAAAVKDDFLDRLTRQTATLRLGDPRDRAVFMGPVVDGRAADRYQAVVAEALRDGRVLMGGERLAGGIHDRGHYLAPVIVDDLTPDHRLNRDELFLPVISVQGFDDLGAAIDDGNRVAYGLTAGCYATDARERSLFLDRAEAGALYVNRASGATTGAWPGHQPFCGWKGSGGAGGKGGLGPWYLPQFLREQSRTIMLD
ncbi:aldehyde dehydrogenase family protein [Tistrella bauzanensis]|uniref:L-glutamate gamma-semialdehyde dehydrogenase n=1 Tax=Tistrella arctica TaxID=3133430 RepID=A0ABU9YF73_9PROT